MRLRSTVPTTERNINPRQQGLENQGIYLSLYPSARPSSSQVVLDIILVIVVVVVVFPFGGKKYKCTTTGARGSRCLLVHPSIYPSVCPSSSSRYYHCYLFFVCLFVYLLLFFSGERNINPRQQGLEIQGIYLYLSVRQFVRPSIYLSIPPPVRWWSQVNLVLVIFYRDTLLFPRSPQALIVVNCWIIPNKITCDITCLLCNTVYVTGHAYV